MMLLKKILLFIKSLGRRSLGKKGSFFLVSTAPLVLLQLSYALFLSFSLGDYERLCRKEEIMLSFENVVLCLFISVLTSFLCDACEKRAKGKKD